MWRSPAPDHYLVFGRVEPSAELRSISHLQNVLAYFYHQHIDFSMSRPPVVCVKCFHARHTGAAACSVHKHTRLHATVHGPTRTNIHTHTHTHTHRHTHTRAGEQAHRLTRTHMHFHLFISVDTHRHFCVWNARIGIFSGFRSHTHTHTQTHRHTHLRTHIYSLLKQTPTEPCPLWGQVSRFLYYTH